MTALIIDDEIEICFLLSSILRQKKLNTNFANSIKEGMDMIVSENPQWVFLDNNLPDGKGTQFISLIKTFNPGIMVVMVTAYDTLEDKEAAFRNGANYYLSKPFNRESIFAIIEESI
ncbi:MAG: response regulator [Chitinophagaceae bacterium]|nr:response regulator [Chitinophagaceae bacterium]